jgi:hypothetical protein
MPRYFLNIVVRGRKAIPDPEGDELAGDKEAREHASMIARDMLERRHWYKRGLEHWTFVVTDETERLGRRRPRLRRPRRHRRFESTT